MWGYWIVQGFILSQHSSCVKGCVSSPISISYLCSFIISLLNVKYIHSSLMFFRFLIIIELFLLSHLLIVCSLRESRNSFRSSVDKNSPENSFMESDEQRLHSNWGHLVGLNGQEAKEMILKERPSLNVRAIPSVSRFILISTSINCFFCRIRWLQRIFVLIE